MVINLPALNLSAVPGVTRSCGRFAGADDGLLLPPPEPLCIMPVSSTHDAVSPESL